MAGQEDEDCGDEEVGEANILYIINNNKYTLYTIYTLCAIGIKYTIYILYIQGIPTYGHEEVSEVLFPLLPGSVAHAGEKLYIGDRREAVTTF